MSLDSPFFSIITVCLNAESAIPGCIDSIQAQDYTQYEHLIIDGGSSDGTLTAIKDRQDHRLRWKSENDHGIADAMNKGVEMAEGDWLIFLQADDRLKNAKSLTSASKRVTESVDVLCCDTEIIEENGKRRTWRADPARTWRKMPGSHQGMIFRKASFLKNGCYDTKYTIAMDYDFVYRMKHSGMTLKPISRTLSVASGFGLSGCRSWVSLKQRFDEERRIHFSHSNSAGSRLLYTLYWSLYLPYRRALSLFR